jgi:hypothetical protein
MGETFRFFIPDIFRAGSVMAKSDVTEFAGQGTLDNMKRKLLVICNNIADRITVEMYRGDSVLVMIAANGNKILSVYAEVFRHFGKGYDKNAGPVFKHRQRINGGGADSVLNQEL